MIAAAVYHVHPEVRRYHPVIHRPPGCDQIIARNILPATLSIPHHEQFS